MVMDGNEINKDRRAIIDRRWIIKPMEIKKKPIQWVADIYANLLNHYPIKWRIDVQAKFRVWNDMANTLFTYMLNSTFYIKK